MYNVESFCGLSFPNRMEYSRVKNTMTKVSMASRVTVMKGAQLDSPPSDSIACNQSYSSQE